MDNLSIYIFHSSVQMVLIFIIVRFVKVQSVKQINFIFVNISIRNYFFKSLEYTCSFYNIQKIIFLTFYIKSY